MSAVSYNKAGKDFSFDEPKPTKIDIGLGDKHLYFKNSGLFSENYLINHLGKSKDSFLMRAWETEDLPAFSALYEWMLSTWQDRREEFETMKEAQLEEEWIRPILQRLGWEYIVQPDLTRHGKRQIPDYALYDDTTAKKKAQKSEGVNVFSLSSAVADAKAMHIDLDGKALDNTNPSYQILQYLTYTNKDWGILTNGRYWRLYSLKSKSKYRAYFEINVEKFLNGNTREDERFKYFFNFFSRAAFAEKNAGNQAFVDIVFSDGEQYAQEVETELKDRAYELVELIAKGFHNSGTFNEGDLGTLYNHSLYYLFRLIFILNCEAKGLLNISRQGDYYKYSLRNLCSSIQTEQENGQKWSSQPRTYNYIKDLFNLLASGDSAVGVHGFGREVFSSGDKRFFEVNAIHDKYLNEVLLNLSCQFDKKKKQWAFIDYQRLSIDHLGSVFEGLLEFKLEPKKGDIALVNTNGERVATGSFYTPDYIVDYIVDTTLTPLVTDKTNKEILQLKIVDPAMGSGHFLLGVVKYLEDRILANLNDGDNSLPKLTPSLVRWEVLHNCIHGADINPLAKELAKFSLWMLTASNTSELELLEDQLICTDSLQGKAVWQKFFGDVMKDGGFHSVVGNPPYLKEANNKKLFEDLRSGPMSEFCAGKMDLWYLFTILSTDILRDGGRHSFIAPNTWTTSEAAGKLRARIRNTATFEQYINFGDYKVFKDASIQTMIYVLSKNSKKSKQGTLYFKFEGNLKEEEVCSRLKGLKSKDFIEVNTSNEAPDAPFVFVDLGAERVFEKIKNAGVTYLSDEEIGSGLDVLQDFVSKTHLPKLKDSSIEAGDGIFVLTNAEAKKVSVSANDKRKIRPYYTTDELDRYLNDEKNKYWVIYADEEVRNNIEKFPGIKKHLDKFKAVLTSAYKPYGLHRPREERLFEGNAIFSVRKTRRPAFSYAEFPAYVARTFMIIKPNNWKESFEYITAVLNSDLIFSWLYSQGKKQGEQLQVDKEPLLAMPIKRIDFKSSEEKKSHDELVKLSQRAALLAQQDDADASEEVENKINALVYKLYGLSGADIKILEASLPSLPGAKGKKIEKKRAA
jgi:hypothetical protein